MLFCHFADFSVLLWTLVAENGDKTQVNKSLWTPILKQKKTSCVEPKLVFNVGQRGLLFAGCCNRRGLSFASGFPNRTEKQDHGYQFKLFNCSCAIINWEERHGRGPKGVTSQNTEDTLSILRKKTKKRSNGTGYWKKQWNKMRKMAQIQLSVTQDSKNIAHSGRDRKRMQC